MTRARQSTAAGAFADLDESLQDDRSAPVDETMSGDVDSFTDEELTELALAADPDRPIDADAVPISLYLGQLTTLLPQWYMPPAIVNRTTRWRTALVIAIVVALVMIDAWGLCSTYGAVVPA
jgi:hypothetical protein